jgi:hypothetical protein
MTPAFDVLDQVSHVDVVATNRNRLYYVLASAN